MGSRSLGEWKEFFSEYMTEGGFERLYEEKAMEAACEVMDDAVTWNPLKHWIRTEAKNHPSCSARFVDDWVRALYEEPKGHDDGPFFEIGDHVEVAQHTAERVEKAGEVIFDLNAFYQYRDAGTWERVRMQDLARVIARFSGAPVASASPNAPASKLKVSSGMIDGVIRVYRDHVDKSGDESRAGFFDQAPAGVMFEDTFLRVDMATKSVVMEDPSPTHRQTIGTGCTFEGDSETPIFDAYMGQVFAGDPDAEDKTRLLLEFIAASLAGIATYYQKALILYDATDRSTGANGKSVLIKVVNSIFPTAAVANISPTQFEEKFTRAMLIRKRINFVTEMPDEHGVISGETTKAIITGEPIKAEEKGQTPFFFTPIAGHIFACNDFPSVSDNSDAFWRRWMVVPFNRTFSSEEADPQLVDKIVQEESSQLFRRLSFALGDLVRRGHYKIPQECADAFSIWKKESDTVLQFLVEESVNFKDRGYIGSTNDLDAVWTGATDLFAAYSDWCKFWGLRGYGKTRFGRRCTKLLEKKRRSAGIEYRVELKSSPVGSRKSVPAPGYTDGDAF